MTIEGKQFVDWFRTASPYIHVHRNRTFVIKFDDDAINADTFTHLVHDLALLNSLGIRLVLVYGTRSSIEKLLVDEPMSQSFHHGLRVTDQETMSFVKLAAGTLRFRIESRLSMGLGNSPMSNAGLRVCSGNYVTAKPMGIIDGVDYQFTGEVRSIDSKAITDKLGAREIVLVPPIGYSTTGEAYNLNADTLAATLASRLGADKLLYLTSVEGVMDANGELVRQLTQQEAQDVLAGMNENDVIYHSLLSSVRAVKAGVSRAHLVDHRIDGAILQELFTRDGCGTMITNSPYDVVRQATINDINGILDLLEPLEQQGILVHRSREKLELEIDHFTLMERDGVLIGCAALYPFPQEQAAEMACLAVHHDYHNDGRGEELLELLENRARGMGITSLFVLTTHAEHWFLDKGFDNATVHDLPVDRKSMYNYQRNSKVLIKKI